MVTITGNNRTYWGVHAKYPIVLSDFNQISNFLTEFHKRPNVRFQRNPSIGRSEYIRGQMDRWAGGRTDPYH